MCRKTILFLIITINLMLYAISASAFIVFDPTNFAQNLSTAISTAASVTKEASMVANQMSMLSNEAKNTTGLNEVIWDDTSQQLNQLADVVQQGQSLSYSMQGLDSQFQQKFPGYQPAQDYSGSYKTWSQTALDTIRGTLDSAGMQSQNMNSEEGTIEQLRQMAKTATGRQQALEVGNQVAAETVNQMQNLRQLVINQTNAQNTYMAYQVQKDQAKEESVNDYLHNIDDTYPKYNDQKGFGPVPDFHE